MVLSDTFMLKVVSFALFCWYCCFVSNVAEFFKLRCSEQLLVLMIFVVHSLVPVLGLIKSFIRVD